MVDGTTVVSEFDRLTGIRQMSADVMSGRKALSIWETVGTVHPASGEPNLQRTRRFVSGRQVVAMEVVKIKAGLTADHGYEPDNFESVIRTASGPAGLYQFSADEDLPDGAVTGVDYPTYRDPETGRRMVTLTAASDDREAVAVFVDPARSDVEDLTGPMDDYDDEDGIDL